jgi:hypothetical protein
MLQPLIADILALQLTLAMDYLGKSRRFRAGCNSAASIVTLMKQI